MLNNDIEAVGSSAFLSESEVNTSGVTSPQIKVSTLAPMQIGDCLSSSCVADVIGHCQVTLVFRGLGPQKTKLTWQCHPDPAVPAWVPLPAMTRQVMADSV